MEIITSTGVGVPVINKLSSGEWIQVAALEKVDQAFISSQLFGRSVPVPLFRFCKHTLQVSPPKL